MSEKVKLNYALFDVDHKKALCEGGKHEESNVQLLCQVCHSIKSGIEQSNFQIVKFTNRST